MAFPIVHDAVALARRVELGASISDIARELEISRQRVQQLVRKGTDPEAYRAREREKKRGQRKDNPERIQKYDRIWYAENIEYRREQITGYRQNGRLVAVRSSATTQRTKSNRILGHRD